MSKVSTLSQAVGILTLIDEQGLDLNHVQLIRPYLVALARAAKIGGLPDVDTFRAVTEGRAKVEVLKYVVDFDKLPSIPDGWEILPDSEQLPNRVKGVVAYDPAKVAFHLDAGQKNGDKIEGNKLRKKLKDVHVYGAQLLDFYLANTRIIPEEWKGGGKAVFFWGTIYRDAGGRPSVRYLYWNGAEWCCFHEQLGNPWFVNNPALVPSN